jgi:hypothetical protein
MRNVLHTVFAGMHHRFTSAEHHRGVFNQQGEREMRKTTWMTTAAVVLACAGALGTAPAFAAPSIFVQVAPPPPRQEVVPAPRRGYVWVPGHWQWQRNRHVWIGGHYLRARRGYSYQEPRWEQRDNRWVYREGNWARGDRDGDGVPNRLDNQPNNPNRR